MRLNQKDILEIVPIRKPMLCVDEICEIDYGNYVEGYRNINKDEYWGNCHFVNQAIFPGTLIIETMAQISAFMFYKGKDTKTLESYLGRVDKAKFLKVVTPDCRMYIKAHLLTKVNNLTKMHCSAYVNNEKVATAEITLFFLNEV